MFAVHPICVQDSIFKMSGASQIKIVCVIGESEMLGDVAIILNYRKSLI